MPDDPTVNQPPSDISSDSSAARRRQLAMAVSHAPGAKPNAAIPELVDVQLATMTKSPPAGQEWLHEIKYDGYRMICRIDRGDVSFISRNQNDWTSRLRPLVRAAQQLAARQAILDGEVVALKPDGSTDFQLLQNAFSGSEAARFDYFAFDLLFLDGYDLTQVRLDARKRLLADLLAVSGVSQFRYSEHVEGDGPSFLNAVSEKGLEGIVSKRRDRPYRAGRGSDWLKAKCIQTAEFVIGGYTEPTGSRIGFGALQVGYHNARGELIYAGRVGTGFNDRVLESLLKRLQGMERAESPFAGLKRAAKTHWVEPKLVAQVTFGSRTRDGQLRHASFQGLRADKPAADVRLDEELPAAAASPNRESPGDDANRLARTPRGSARRVSQSAAKSPDATYNTRAQTYAGVRFTSPDKLLYPDQGITKLDLAKYYQQIANSILPHLANRPIVIVRCPEGRHEDCFYQKHPIPGTPDKLRQIPIPERTKVEKYVVVDDVDGLISLAQIACLEIHGWGSRADKLEHPDRIIFDLDPDVELPWSVTVESARQVREFLQELGFESFVKTTGGKGLHLVVPIVRRHDWRQVTEFCGRVAGLIVAADPKRYTANMSKAARPGRIFFDYLRNGRGATAVVPFSTRARPGAPVSAPLDWRELNDKLVSDHFNVRNMPQRLASLKVDPWATFSTLRQSLAGPIKKLRGLGGINVRNR